LDDELVVVHLVLGFLVPDVVEADHLLAALLRIAAALDVVVEAKGVGGEVVLVANRGVRVEFLVCGNGLELVLRSPVGQELMEVQVVSVGGD